MNPGATGDADQTTDADLEAVAEAEAEAEPAADDVDVTSSAGDDFVTVSAANLLVEQETSEVRVAGDAELRHGRRRIAAPKRRGLVVENRHHRDDSCPRESYL